MKLGPIGAVNEYEVYLQSAELTVQDSCFSVLKEELSDIFAEPQGMPPVCGVAHRINLVDESTTALYFYQFHVYREEEQAVWDKIDIYQMKGQIRLLTSGFRHPILIM